jgi:hypothetical protein
MGFSQFAPGTATLIFRRTAILVWTRCIGRTSRYNAISVSVLSEIRRVHQKNPESAAMRQRAQSAVPRWAFSDPAGRVRSGVVFAPGSP